MADACAMAVSLAPQRSGPLRHVDAPDDIEWCVTPSGIEVPLTPVARYNTGLDQAVGGTFRVY